MVYPETAARLQSHVSEILVRWEVRVRHEIPASRYQEQLVLQNNLQWLLYEVARTLHPDGQLPRQIEGLTLSQDHGGHRAGIDEYSVGEVFLEYRILRQTILEVLDEKATLAPVECEVINNALERAMQESVSRFVLVHQDVQQAQIARLRTIYEREQRISRVLQRPLLVQPATDMIPGFTLASRYVPAMTEAEVGGDFLDVFAVKDQIALVIGDASGKGVEAAAHNMLVKEMLHAFLRTDPTHPGAALAKLNEVVCDTFEAVTPDEFGSTVALALLILNPLEGRACYSSAGAVPLLLVRQGGEIQEVGAGGMLLGVAPDQLYPEEIVHLDPGDTVTMVTDGITEARVGGRLLGYEGLTRVVQEALKADTLEQSVEEILHAARTWAAGTLSDDACVLMLRCDPRRAGIREADLFPQRAARRAAGASRRVEGDSLL